MGISQLVVVEFPVAQHSITKEGQADHLADVHNTHNLSVVAIQGIFYAFTKGHSTNLIRILMIDTT